MKKQNLLFIGLLLLLGTLLLACQPQVENAAEPENAVETGSEMAEEASVEEETMDEEMAMEDETHSDEEMVMEDETHSDDEMAMDEEGEVVYIVAAADSVVNWKGAKAVGNSHTGTIDISDGSLTVENGALVSGSFVIDMTTLSPNDGAPGRLTSHLKSDDFFGVDTYPTASLVINSAESLGGDQYAVMGDLTIKEITHPLEFTATASEADGQVIATADIVFDRALYDVQYGSGSFFDGLGDDLINDEIEISVSLLANK